MSPTPSLPEIGVADVGRTFVMRPGSRRALVIDAGAPPLTVRGDDGVVGVQPDGDAATPGRQSFLLTAIGRGRVTIRSGDAEWHIEVRGASHRPEQTRDDMDMGWGEKDSAMSQRWWEEQRPPHW